MRPLRVEGKDAAFFRARKPLPVHTLGVYDFGSKLSITLSMLKLAGLARGGNSLKDSNHWATSACAGTKIKR